MCGLFIHVKAFTTVQEELYTKDWCKRCGYILVSCAETHTQAKSKQFHVIWHCMYKHTHGILFTYTPFTQAHSYTYKLQVPHTIPTQASKKGHRAPYFVARPQAIEHFSLSDLPVTVQTPPLPVGTLMVDLWLRTPSLEVSQTFHPVPVQTGWT